MIIFKTYHIDGVEFRCVAEQFSSNSSIEDIASYILNRQANFQGVGVTEQLFDNTILVIPKNKYINTIITIEEKVDLRKISR